MKLIDKDAVLAEIEKYIDIYKDGDKYDTYAENVLITLKKKVNSLEVKEVYISNPQFPHLKDIIDKVFGAGNLEFWEYDDAEQLVLLAKDEVISQVCVAAGMKKPYKDGNQWCILKGENIQEGICGFGDNIEDALVDFLRNIPKIPLELREINLEDEIRKVQRDYKTIDEYEGYFATIYASDIEWIAKHFYELGVRKKKEEKYEVPSVSKTEDVSVTSRMAMIDDDLKPIAEFILDYAGWNLHKDEWNHPVLEVPLFRVLDALIQRGKPYCGKN